MERPAEIGASIVIKGEVTAREDVVISGRVEGSITVEGHSVIVNAGAELAADVEARQVMVSGQVLGTVCAADRIELLGTAVVDGEIEAPSLKIADGAIFNGKATTTRAMKPKDLQLAS